MAENLFLCGMTPAQRAQYKGGRELRLHGSSPNVILEVDDIRKRLVGVEAQLLTDLLELAVYVFAADCSIRRGGPTFPGMGATWRRTFKLVVAVREPGLWAEQGRLAALTEALHFLSDDDWTFEFVDLQDPPKIQHYFKFSDGSTDRPGDTSIVLFSGGIDSFAGAVHELTTSNQHVVLMSRSIPGMTQSRQKELAGGLKDQFTKRVTHAALRAGLTSETHAREDSQRTRSFLLSAIALAAAEMEIVDRIRFFENGIMSVNLPISAQVVGTRASRSTHPRSLLLLQQLAGFVTDSPVTIDNPFIWKTKVEVVADLQKTPLGAFTPRTLSCSNTRGMSKMKPHCGRCAQCLQRRISTLGANAPSADPEEGYLVDLLDGARHTTQDRAMAVDTIRSALEFYRMSEADFLTQQASSLAWITTAFPGTSPEEVAQKCLAMFKRHGAAVHEIFTKAIRYRAEDLLHGRLSTDCLVRIFANGSNVDQAMIAEKAAQETNSASKVTLAEQAPTDHSLIMLTIDGAQHEVLIGGIRICKGATDFRLFVLLATQFREDQKKELKPENYQQLPSDILASEIGSDEQNVRKAISRIRLRIQSEYKDLHGEELALDDAIESCHGRGYRLNPWKVRLVAPSEIR
jgi:hypothetical protein